MVIFHSYVSLPEGTPAGNGGRYVEVPPLGNDPCRLLGAKVWNRVGSVTLWQLNTLLKGKNPRLTFIAVNHD